jgi:hypothetical protein
MSRARVWQNLFTLSRNAQPLLGGLLVAYPAGDFLLVESSPAGDGIRCGSGNRGVAGRCGLREVVGQDGHAAAS